MPTILNGTDLTSALLTTHLNTVTEWISLNFHGFDIGSGMLDASAIRFPRFSFGAFLPWGVIAGGVDVANKGRRNLFRT